MQAELLTGRLYFDGKRVPADPVLAEKYFLKARAVLPAADYFLGEMYYRGYLGKSDPQRALEYLLSAARRGHAKADYALAEMFWTGKGIQRNPVYALSFATLAAEAAADDIKFQTLHSSIAGTANPMQQNQAERLRQQEVLERKKAGVAVGGPAMIRMDQARK
jgi:alginate biosynthesis protein AlgK